MDRSIRDSILILERQIAEWKNRRAHTKFDSDQRQILEFEIQAAEQTLELYQSALEIEEQIAVRPKAVKQSA